VQPEDARRLSRAWTTASSSLDVFADAQQEAQRLRDQVVPLIAANVAAGRAREEEERQRRQERAQWQQQRRQLLQAECAAAGIDAEQARAFSQTYQAAWQSGSPLADAQQEAERLRAQVVPLVAQEVASVPPAMQLSRSVALDCTRAQLAAAWGNPAQRVLACKACAASGDPVAARRRFQGHGLLMHCKARHGLQL
jgi:hypothetical protein